MASLFKTLIFSALSTLILPSVAIPETWSCPNAKEGRALFVDGQMAELPNYSESHGARVQRQYPNTAFVGAQAKFIDRNGRTGAICQYYSHIGLVATSVVIGVERLPDIPVCESEICQNGPYWRYEFTESSPDLDKESQEQMLVCMEYVDGLAFPSTRCGFELKD